MTGSSEPALAFKPANTTRVHAQMIFARTLTATSFPIGAAITHGLDPGVLTLTRFALASVLFAPFVFLRHGFALPTLRALFGYALIGGSLVVFFWCMFEALRTTTALNTGAIMTLVPGISAIYAAILLRERLGVHRLVAMGCGLVGALWVVFRGDPERLFGLVLNWGDLVFLFGCLAFGLYTPLVKLFHRQEPAAVMTFWTLVTGTGWLLLFNFNAVFATDWSGVDTGVLLGIAYLAIFTTLISFFIAQHGALHIGPTLASSYSYLNPALVILIEILIGNGLPPLAVLPGVAIIVAATFVIQLGAGARSGTK